MTKDWAAYRYLPILLMSHSGGERVREGSTMPAKQTGVGS
jgi:hypothetical protein